jgi:hypothetical protein
LKAHSFPASIRMALAADARFSLKMDRCPAELTVADLRFYRVFTQVLNSPFIRGVPQSKPAPGFSYCAPAQ